METYGEMNNGKSKSYEWVYFYMELATKLIPYRNNRFELISRLKDAFRRAGYKRTFDDDIDPFTLFGLFNNRGITPKARIRITAAIGETFSVDSQPPTEFDGVPTFYKKNTTAYQHAGIIKEQAIDNLWNVFISAIEFSDIHDTVHRDRFIQDYEKVNLQNTLDWNVTEGLFWIRPLDFLNLDFRNRWFISQSKYVSEHFVKLLPVLYIGSLKDTIPTGSEYLDLCENMRRYINSERLSFRNFAELSAAAWHIVYENEKKTDEEETKFKNWVAEHLNSDHSLPHYVGCLKELGSLMIIKDFPEITNLFLISNIHLFDKVYAAIMAHPDYRDVNDLTNNYLNTSLKNYYRPYLNALKIEDENRLPEEIEENQREKIVEGAKCTITVNSYECDPKAKKDCKDYYLKRDGRIICQICRFDFWEKYGSEYKNLIHVHHIVPLSRIGEEYVLDPIKDLIPVCPNCHMVLHTGSGISVEELREKVQYMK